MVGFLGGRLSKIEALLHGGVDLILVDVESFSSLFEKLLAFLSGSLILRRPNFEQVLKFHI